MPRILPLAADKISSETKEAFEKHFHEHHSRITNMKATMARSLLAFEIYMRWYDLYDAIIAITGERLACFFAHSISLGSHCPLCTTYFRKILIEHGEKPEAFTLSDDEQALLDFGSAMANNRGEVADELYEALRKIYSEKDIVVLVAFAGQMIATNVFSNALEVEIDDYLAPYTSLTKK